LDTDQPVFPNCCYAAHEPWSLGCRKEFTYLPDMHDLVGPFSYENWKAFDEGESSLAFEYPLFTDARILGEIREGLGPYQLLNPVVSPSARKIHPSIILRSEECTKNQLPDMSQTDDARYHGGLLSDEIASIVSLSLGIRLKSANANRVFSPDDDARGRPLSGWGYSADPILPELSVKPVLPNLLGEHRLEKVGIFTTFPTLTSSQAVALVRSARLYQEAVWIAETTPELSWLMLVSAVESAAGVWRTEGESSVERLKTSRPELEKILIEWGGEELLELVAQQIAPYMGATKTFLDFTLEFMPPPPAIRPRKAFRHPWSRKALKNSLSKIYGYRSRALHGGMPFPAPMCQAPEKLYDNIESEIPLGLAASMLGAVWVAEDIPMLLHTFEYIVRNSLLSWWASMQKSSNAA
jgi:hypothetical protein